MYRNITEILTERKLDEMIDKYECCKCEKCHDDIMAYALNRLPAKYVSTDEGELFVKAETLLVEYDFTIMKTLAMAIQIVKDSPRHQKID